MSDRIKRVSDIVSGLENELRDLALKIHSTPELGHEEFKACQWQIELLEKYGFKVERNFCGMATAYKAVYKGKKSGPKIAMLAEYDALPELGHGCGHNLIAMVGVGSGIAMSEFADEYGGEIYVIGTPAEETAGGKVEMARQGAFNDMDVAMMAHPAYMNCDSLNTMATTALRFEFFGVPSHAASTPYEGINALDGVINFFNMVNALRQQTKSDARIHGIIKKGGVAPNIIPDYAEALFYVRTNKTDYLDELREKVINCAKGAALGTGTRLEVSSAEEDFKDTNSNMTLSNLCCDQVEKLGVEVLRLNGETVPGSSDLGDVSYSCPAVQTVFKIGDAEGNPFGGAHTERFAECAGSEFGIQSGLTYIKGFTMTAIELMTEPKHLKAIKEEFSKIAK